MQKPPLRKRPSYSIDSVDNALRLLQLLRDEGSVRLNAAAIELDVAPSTAHRLLAMLVYRGFAFQDESRAYVPGPSLGVGPVRVPWIRQVRDLARPHLELLSGRLDETTNLMIRVGTKVRFLMTAESSNILRIGDRQGSVLPARTASGGRALLAGLSEPILERMYRSASAQLSDDRMTDEEFADLLAELRAVRLNGYAVNDEATEVGVGALGVALSAAGDRPIAAFSVAVPISRFASILEPATIALIMATKREIEYDLRENGVDGPLQADDPTAQ